MLTLYRSPRHVGRDAGAVRLLEKVFGGGRTGRRDTMATMTRDGYEASDIVRLVEKGSAQLLADYINEADETKQLLRNAGFGVTGTGLLETVKEALAALADQFADDER